MLPQIKQYLDLLDDEAVDRVLMAQKWCTRKWLAPDGSKCLRGHAEHSEYDTTAFCGFKVAFPMGLPAMGLPTGAKFDEQCHRYGIDNVVKEIKQYLIEKHELQINLEEHNQWATSDAT